jgi:hypothetical protein
MTLRSTLKERLKKIAAVVALTVMVAPLLPPTAYAQDATPGPDSGSSSLELPLQTGRQGIQRDNRLGRHKTKHEGDSRQRVGTPPGSVRTWSEAKVGLFPKLDTEAAFQVLVWSDIEENLHDSIRRSSSDSPSLARESAWSGSEPSLSFSYLDRFNGTIRRRLGDRHWASVHTHPK